MKTNSIRRNALYYAFFYVLLFGMSHSGFSQCPMVTNASPPAICDASGFTFNDLNAYATDGGSGIVWYNASSGGSAFNTNELVSEGTYYAGDGAGICLTRAPITIAFEVSATGQNLQGFFCSNENPTIQSYIDLELQSNAPVGGTVEVYYDQALASVANLSDAIPTTPTNYYIVFIDILGCRSQIENGIATQFQTPPDPTPPNTQAFCSDTNPTVSDLDPGTTGVFFWYDNIDIMGDPVLPALIASDALVSGNTYYIQSSSGICSSEPVSVIVNIDDPVNAGTPGTLEYCNNNLPSGSFDLFDELGGLKDTTGTWSGPVATSNGNLGTINIASLTTADTYIFTYTVPSNGVCPDGVSTVTITVYETLSPGDASAANPASFCEAGLPSTFDLFTLLENHDLGGQWTQGASIISNPSTINLTGLLASGSPYNFTYTQNLLPNPCPEDFITVQVIVLEDPNAGIANNQIFCENDLAANSPFDLFDALTSPYDSGGIWTDSSGANVSNNIDITGFVLTGSPYEFTYTVDNGTCTDDETISITIDPAPESGTANAPAEFCEGAAPASFDLYSLVEDESGTGVWTNNNTSAIVTDPTNLDLSGFAVDTYNFTFNIDPIGLCDDVDVVVSIVINPLPDTGTPNNPPPFCENDAALSNTTFDLFTLLNAPVDAGGTWSDDSATPISGVLSGNVLDLSQLIVGTYNFTYSITDANNCSNSSTVVIIVDPAPESGTANAPAEFCEGAAPASFDLYSLVEDESGTGVWTNNNTSAIVTDPTNLDLSGFAVDTYNFTFNIDPIGLCDDVDVVVSIVINPLPDTGTPNNPPPFCENDAALSNTTFDLFTLLNAPVDAGGTWSDDSATPVSGVLSGNILDLSQLIVGTYNFTYSITDANNCSNSSTVVIIVDPAPESGTANAPIQFCLADVTVGQTYDLFELLSDEDQTGNWNDDDNSLALTDNIVSVDMLAEGTYNFTYNVDAIGICDDVDVTVSIIINDTPAPTVVTPQEFCDTATVGNLDATGTNIQWYDAATDGNLLTDATALVDGQMYYATQTDATTNCESSMRTVVTATIYQSPNPGLPNTTAIVSCNNNTSIDLFSGLDGTQDTGGAWQNDNSAGSLTGNIFDATGVSEGTYNFTYLVTASSPCVDDSVTITVTIEEPLNAGSTINPTLDMCSNEGTTDLFTELGGADTGGVWSPALTSTTGIFDPLVDVDGTYTYTLTNSCETITNQVEVTVTLAPNAGADGVLAICVGDDSTDLFTLLGTGAQSGGVWSPELTSTTGVFDPAVDGSGTYTYTVTAVAPCSPDAIAEIVVTVSDTPAVLVLDSDPEFCAVDNPTVADLSNSISPTGTVNWYDDLALTMPLLSTDDLVNGEDYYATQTTGACESSIAVQINVIINNTSTPTLKDASMDYCINDEPTLLTLSDNITEYDVLEDNIVWYDSPTGGSTISEDTALSDTTYYAALVDAVTGCESSIRLEIIPDITACGKLSIPDGFSPNGDGINDTFNVDNLAFLYPNFEMEIYNRNGNIVYKGNANSSRFDGTSNQSRIVSKGDLPVGVYFYIFNFNDGENKPEQGRLYLSR